MKRILLITISIVFFSKSTFSQEKLHFQNFNQKADTYMKALNYVGEFSGMVLVAHKGNIIFQKGYGYASKRFDVLNSREVKYRIGSMTKSFTAIAILQLVEKDLISLKDPVSKFIDNYPFGDSINIENLLSHTSGIKRDIKFDDENKKYSLEELIKMSEVDTLLYKPGTEMTYSNCGYVLLQAILEKVSGESYKSYVTKNILKPLNLKHTGIENPLMPPKFMADGYGRGVDDNGNFALIETQMQSHGYPDGVGAMYSTSEDLLKFSRAIGKSNLLKPKTWEKALKPFIEDAPNGYKWGFGFNIIQGKSFSIINHNGRTDGFRGGYFQFSGEDDITMIVLGNNSDAERSAIINAFYSILKGNDYYTPKMPSAINLEPFELDRYAGVYNAEDFSFEIIKHNSSIYVKSHGDSPVKLIPFKKNAFFCNYYDLIIEFINENEKAVGASWIYKGETLKAKRASKL